MTYCTRKESRRMQDNKIRNYRIRKTQYHIESKMGCFKLPTSTELGNTPVIQAMTCPIIFPKHLTMAVSTSILQGCIVYGNPVTLPEICHEVYFNQDSQVASLLIILKAKSNKEVETTSNFSTNISISIRSI